MTNGLPVHISKEAQDESPISSENLNLAYDYIGDLDEFENRRPDEPLDPVAALGCDNFICFLSKYDIMKTENGYLVVPAEVISIDLQPGWK